MKWVDTPDSRLHHTAAQIAQLRKDEVNDNADSARQADATLNNGFLEAVERLAELNSTGRPISLPFIDVGLPRPTVTFDRNQLLKMVKSTANRLLSQPWVPQVETGAFVRNGKSVVVQTFLVANRDADEVLERQHQWWEEELPVEFPTAVRPDDERDYATANGLMLNIVHKDVGTLLRLLTMSSHNMTSVTLAVVEHYLGQADRLPLCRFRHF